MQMKNSRLVLGLREQIVDQLRNDVLCGRLIEGERLSEMKLVQRFGVSRTPIREALQQLTHEGLLEGRPNVGVSVAHRPPDEVAELIVPVRQKVEVFALRSFFDRITEQDYRHWSEILERMRKACIDRDYATIAEEDIAFHRYIVRRAGQRDLEAIWTSILGRISHHFRETQQENYTDPLDIYDEHVAIVEVFRSGDVDAAVKAIEDNIA